MDPDYDYADLLDFAKRYARRMSKDPEVQSIAGEAMLYMVRKFNPAFNVRSRFG
jgi:hypothetical protein